MKKIILLIAFLFVFSFAASMDYHWTIGYYDVQKISSNKAIDFWQEYYIMWGHQGIAAAEYFLGLQRKWIAVYFLKQEDKWQIFYIDTTRDPANNPTDEEIYDSLPNIVFWSMKNIENATMISYNYITKSVRIKFHPKYDKNYNFYKRQLKIIKKKYYGVRNGRQNKTSKG